jgi:hypothetical protein
LGSFYNIRLAQIESIRRISEFESRKQSAPANATR